MLCQNCKKNQANTHIKMIENGELSEYMLCSECAAKMGYANVFSNFLSTGFDNLFGSLFDINTNTLATPTKCSVCGSTFGDITKSGRVGCDNCYNIFYDELLPSIRRIHGNTEHCGKRLGRSSVINDNSNKTANSKESQIEILNKQLQTAIDKQEFEKAAELRDKIKSLKENNEN